MKIFKALAVAAGLFASPLLADDTAPEAEPAPVEIMILGTYHFANPGQDVVNMEVDDVLAERRQREIAVLVDTLAEWQPTKVAVENEATPPELTMASYADTESLLTARRSETVQVGYRLASQLGHDAVYGYDERGGEGEPDYFPFGKVMAFAQENGGADALNAMFAEVQAMAAEEQAKLSERTIAQSLLRHNRADELDAMHDQIYYSMLTIGDGNQQPGAELNAYWYMRNAKMFAKIDMIAEPGDRVLVIAGSGHATWLRHFAQRVPGYTLVDTLPYIERAVERSEALSD